MSVFSAHTSAQTRDVLRAAALALEDETDVIGMAIARELHRSIPVLTDDERTLQETARGSATSIRVFLAAVRTGEPMAASDPAEGSIRAARALARAGERLRHLVRMMTLGHGIFLAAWERKLAQMDLPAEERLAATLAASEITFAWIDQFGERLTDEYEREHERLVRSGEAQRARAIRAVLAGEVRDQDAMSQVLRYDLRRTHTAMILWSAEDRGDPGAELEQEARSLAARFGAGSGRPLMLWASDSVLWVWVGTDGMPPTELLDGHVTGGSVSVAIGESADGAAGFQDSHRDAAEAFRVALLAKRRPGSITRFTNVAPAAMLSTDLDRTRRLIRRRLGELATNDDHHARLRATLRVFLEEWGSRQATSQRLGIHANTVGNRVRACQDILGEDFGGTPGELHLALWVAELLGDAALEPVGYDARSSNASSSASSE